MPAINSRMTKTLNQAAGLNECDAASLGCIYIFPLAETGSREGCTISRHMTGSTVPTTVSVLCRAVNDRRVVVMDGNAGQTHFTRGVGVVRGSSCLVRGQSNPGGMAAWTLVRTARQPRSLRRAGTQSRKESVPRTEMSPILFLPAAEFPRVDSGSATGTPLGTRCRDVLTRSFLLGVPVPAGKVTANWCARCCPARLRWA